MEVVQFLRYLLLELGVSTKCNRKAFSVMLSLLLGRYYSIDQTGIQHVQVHSKQLFCFTGPVLILIQLK